MNTNRLLNIVLTDLTLTNLKLQEELEQTINTGGLVDTKVENIKDLLEKITINELMVTKFNTLINNEDKKQ